MGVGYYAYLPYILPDINGSRTQKVYSLGNRSPSGQLGLSSWLKEIDLDNISFTHEVKRKNTAT